MWELLHGSSNLTRTACHGVSLKAGLRHGGNIVSPILWVTSHMLVMFVFCARFLVQRRSDWREGNVLFDESRESNIADRSTARPFLGFFPSYESNQSKRKGMCAVRDEFSIL